MCVFSEIKDMKHIERYFHSVVRVMPQGQNFNFPNMVMWHIKLKGMVSTTGYKKKIHPMVNLATLGWGQKVKYH